MELYLHDSTLQQDSQLLTSDGLAALTTDEESVTDEAMSYSTWKLSRKSCGVLVIRQ